MKDRNVITPPLHKEAEFGELYKRYKARFESFAVGYVQDRLIAEDVVTDAFIYYWENRSRLDADCNAAAYILTTIRHKCLNYLRALQVRMRVHNEVGDLQRRVVSENIRSLELCDPQHLFAGEIEKLVRDCMAEMPELTRQVFTARRIHGKSYREIAADEKQWDEFTRGRTLENLYVLLVSLTTFYSVALGKSSASKTRLENAE